MTTHDRDLAPTHPQYGGKLTGEMADDETARLRAKVAELEATIARGETGRRALVGDLVEIEVALNRPTPDLDEIRAIIRHRFYLAGIIGARARL